MGLKINLVWDTDALAAPASFRTGIEQAAAILEAAIDTPITVNIQVGYGEYDLSGSAYQVLNSDYSLGGINTGVDISYDALTAALASVASSSTDTEAVSSLPATASMNGLSEFYISNSLAKAFGALPATGTEIDGNVGFPSSFTGSTLVAAGIVELLHAMGLLNGDGPESLVEYISTGNHFLNGGTTSTPAYFSLDGGKTHLANYDVTYDSTLFENLPNDPLDVPDVGVTTLTALDLEEIGAIGFNTNGNESLPTVSITPVVASNGLASIKTKNVTIHDGSTVAATSFISSVTASSSAGIVSYEFYASGTDGGYFTIDGIKQPDEQYFDVLSTQLGDVDYVGGSSPGKETDFIYADDAATDELTGSSFTVTATAGIALCFAAGTHIRTPDGDVLVEDLGIGNLVSTHVGPRPIKWIGRRYYDGRFIGNNHFVLPILIRPHAIAENCPSRELWVSPGHGICVSNSAGEQNLVPAWRLINGSSIVQAANVDRIDYFHIELEDHALLFAENLAAESFFEIEGFRDQFQNGSEFARLYPGAGAPGQMCLPRIEDGFALQDIQNRIARRAGLQIQRELPSLTGLRGAYDLTGDGCVTGWAAAESQPGVALTIAVKINGKWAAYGLANRYRQDLRDAGIGNGCHAFAFALPPNATGPIEVCHALTGTPLNFCSTAEALSTVRWVSAA